MRLEFEAGSITPTGRNEDAFHHGTMLHSNDIDLVREGIAAAREGERARARTLLHEAVERNKNSEAAWLWLASISDYPEELLMNLEHVLEINPTNQRALEWKDATNALLAKTLVQRGIDACKQKEDGPALHFFREALKHEPENQIAIFWVDTLLNSDHSAGESDSEAAVEDEMPDGVASLLDEAKSAAICGDRDRANRLIDEFLEASPESSEAWTIRADIAENFEDKLYAFQRILEFDPDNISARISYDSLIAMVETVAPDKASDAWDRPQFAGDSIYIVPESSILDDAHINGPTQELELPAEILRNNPFVENEHPSDPILNDWPAYTSASCSGDLIYPSEMLANEDCDIQEVLAAVSMSEAYNGDESVWSIEPDNVPSDSFDVMEMSAEEDTDDGGRHDVPRSPETSSCPFCNNDVVPHAIICDACSAMLTLSDLDALLAHQVTDDSFIRGAIRRIENKSEEGTLPVSDFVHLALGYLNLNDLDSAFECLREASLRDPNDVMISGHLNTLAIRIDENRRHSETHPEMVKGKTILVVDDSATVRKLISGKLEKCGHNVVCAGDGSEAMEALSGLKPDLILLDVAMPRMDGYQTCKAIRSNPQTAGIPVIMISGKDGFFDKVRGRRAGTTDYITKPFGPETLMRALETYLDAGPAAPAAE